ncbi:hypothetical protein AAVH_17606 [Aphelenchoides avenae]|nr:hypothetical protein AAVH_17606 [Aphelenchus avenae]
MPSGKKSPIWKYFVGSDQRMTCLLCQHALTSRTGKFLASNLERHLRTKHANSDTYREFQRDKDQWTEECGRVRISHIISLPNTKRPRAPVENEEERKERRRASLRESQERHRLRKKVIWDSVHTDVLHPSAYCGLTGTTTDIGHYVAVGLQQSILPQYLAGGLPDCSTYEAEGSYGHIPAATGVQYLLMNSPTQTGNLCLQMTAVPGGSFNGDNIARYVHLFPSFSTLFEVDIANCSTKTRRQVPSSQQHKTAITLARSCFGPPVSIAEQYVGANKQVVGHLPK